MVTSLANLTTQFLSRPSLNQKTIRSYESALMPLLKKYGAVPISHLTRQQIEQYLNDLTHLSYTTRNRHQAIVQSLFNFAVEQGYLEASPLAKLKPQKANANQGEQGTDEVIRYLDKKQLTILYYLLEQNRHIDRFYRLEVLVKLLHQTGARISELLALDYKQMDLSERKFKVLGKGNKQRWCFYSASLDKQLNNYLRLYRAPTHPALFTAEQPKSKKITRLSYRTAYQDWREIISLDPALQGCRFHDLRHTFATERVGLIAIEELRALMGHERITTTLRYQKVTSSRAEVVAKEALENLENANF